MAFLCGTYLGSGLVWGGLALWLLDIVRVNGGILCDFMWTPARGISYYNGIIRISLCYIYTIQSKVCGNICTPKS